MLRCVLGLLSLCSLFALVAVISGPAVADDFVVDTATTTTNGGNTIDGNDTLTITKDGSITPPSGDSGVYSAGGSNTITNSGSLTIQGDNTEGILNDSSSNSPVTNSGTIDTQGNSSHGIVNNRSDNSPVTNSGTIHVEGAQASGIYNYRTDNSPITNSGSIDTKGYQAYGIQNFDSFNSAIANSGSIHTVGRQASGILNDGGSSAITNSGTISTGGESAYGIFNSETKNSPITNSGTIHTTGNNASGIESNKQINDSAVTNSGTIHTEGSRGYGIHNIDTRRSPVTNSGAIHTQGGNASAIYIQSSRTTAVTNSGYVVSELSNSFRFQNSTNSPLNLLAPSYIGGAFSFQSTTTLNITTGPSHSVLWTLPANMTGGAPNISGTVPWFYNSTTQQFATYDPTALAGSLDALGDMTGLLSQVGRAGLNGKGLWVTGFGGSYDHDGDAMTLGRDIAQWGVAMGYRGPSVAGFDWGLMAGYLNTELDAESRWTQSYDISGEGWFAGLNARQTLGGVVIDFGLTGGRVDYDQSRFVNDNLALTGGLTLGKSWADSSYAGWFVSPEIGVSTLLATFDGWSFTPAARLRYAAQWLDGFSESGSNANAVVGSRDLGMIEASGEIEAAKTVGNATVSGRIGYLSRISTGDEAVSMTLIGVTNSVGFGDTDTEALYAGAGFDLDLGLARLALDVTGFLSGDFTGAQGMARIAVPF